MGKRHASCVLAALAACAVLGGCREARLRRRVLSPEGCGTLLVRTDVGAHLVVARLGRLQEDVAPRFEGDPADGFWIEVGMPRGDYRVRATRAGYARTSRDLTLWPGPHEMTLVLEPEAVLAGQVSAGGEPLADATVRGSQMDEHFEARTDAAGRFAFVGVAAGPVKVSAEKAGFEPVEQEALAPSEALVLRTRRLHRLAGQVRAAGVAVPKAVVRIGGSGLWPPRDVLSDDRGEYAVDLVEGVYEIRAQAPGLASSGLASVDLGEGGGQHDLNLLPAASLRGRIRADDGAPVSGAAVTLQGTAALDVDRAAESDATGEFVIGPLPGGPYAISVAAAGFLPAAAGPTDLVPPLDARLEVTLVRGAALRGQVVDDVGRPIPGVRIEVVAEADGRPRSAASRRVGKSALIPRGELGVTRGRVPWPFEATGAGDLATDESGAFLADGLPAGPATVSALHTDFSEAQAEIFLKQRRTATVRLVMLRGAEIAGRIFDDAGHALADVRVHGRRADGAEGGTMTGPSGDYSLRGLAGRVEIEAERSGYVSARRVVEVAQRARLDRIDLALVPADFAVEGRLVDEGGVPVAGARVRLRPARGLAREATSDPRGYFEARGLPPGPTTVEVTHAAFPPLLTSVLAERGEPLDLVLPYGGGIEGFARDVRTHEPLAEFTVACGKASTTARAGDFLLAPLPVGPCTLEVTSPGYAPDRQPIDVAPGGAPGEITVHGVLVEMGLP